MADETHAWVRYFLSRDKSYANYRAISRTELFGASHQSVGGGGGLMSRWKKQTAAFKTPRGAVNKGVIDQIERENRSLSRVQFIPLSLIRRRWRWLRRRGS